MLLEKGLVALRSVSKKSCFANEGNLFRFLSTKKLVKNSSIQNFSSPIPLCLFILHCELVKRASLRLQGLIQPRNFKVVRYEYNGV